MDFSGTMIFNKFSGDENKRESTRAIVRIGGSEFAIYLNHGEAGTTVAVSAVTGRNGNSPIIAKDSLATGVCRKETAIKKVEWVIKSLQWDNVSITDYAICFEQVNVNDNTFRYAMPREVAEARFGLLTAADKAAEAAEAAAATGTKGF